MTILYTIPLPDYADGVFDDPNYSNQTVLAPGATISVASDATAGSGKCLRFGVVSDGTDQTYRSEISGAKAGGNLNPGVMSALLPGTEIWVGFSVCYNLAADAMTEGSIWQLLSNYGFGYDAQQPNAGIYQKHGRLGIHTRYDLTLNAPDNSTIVEGGFVDLGRIMQGRWTRIVLHLKLSLGEDALIEVYRDRVLMATITTPNTYNRRHPDTGVPLAQYIKFGNYSYAWKTVPAAAGIKTIWDFDYLMVGGSDSSLEEMMDVLNAPVPSGWDTVSTDQRRWQGDDLLRSTNGAIVAVNGRKVDLDTGPKLSDYGVLDNLSDLSRWTVVAANPGGAGIEEIPLLDGVGPTCLKVTTAAGASATATITKDRTFNLASRGGMWVLWTNNYLMTGATPGMGFYMSHSTGMGAAPGRAVAANRLSNQSFGRTSEWIANSDWTVSAGTPDFNNTFQSLRMQVSAAAQDARDYTIDGIVMPLAHAKAQILFTLDDGVNTGYSVGHLEAFSRAIPLTHYIIASKVGGVGYSTAEQIAKMKACGDYIGVHGESPWTNIDALRIDLEMLGDQGLADLAHASWPNGAIGTGYAPAAVIEAAKALGLKSIRKTGSGANGCFLRCYQNPWVLPGVALRETTSLAAAKNLIDKAIAAGGTLIFYGHGFGAVANATTWVTADWIQLLDYVAQKRLDGLCECLTINQISFN